MFNRQISTLSSSSISNDPSQSNRRSDALPKTTIPSQLSIQKSKSSSCLPDTDLPPTSPSSSASASQPTIRQQVSQATVALKSLPPTHPAATTHLLTRSSLYLRYYHIARSKPSHNPPPIAYLQHSIKDARHATQNAPSLPAAWLALFSSLRTAGKFDQAKHTIQKALLFCPYDHTLQIALDSLERDSQNQNQSTKKQTQNLTTPPPLKHRAKDHLHLTQHSIRGKHSQVPHSSSTSSTSLSRFRSTKSSPAATTIGSASSSTTTTTTQSHQEQIQNPRSTFRFSHSHSHRERPAPNTDFLPSPTSGIHMDKLQRAEDSFLLGAFDDAIRRYTQVIVDLTASTMSNKDDVKADSIRLQCLARRSEAWLRKAVQDDNLRAFRKATIDAKLIVAENPQWQYGWIRLGNAHLENGAPGKAKLAFEKGLNFCPQSEEIKQGLKDAIYVIQREGYETDWNAEREEEFEESSDESVAQEEPESTGDTFEEITVVKPKGRRLRGKEHVKRVFKRQQSRSRIRGRRDSLSSVPDNFDEIEKKTPAKEKIETERGVSTEEQQNSNQQDRSGSFISTADKLSTAHHKLYDLLEIPKDANGATIKRSYYSLAKKYHPDKNHDDLGAKDKFQQLAEAYRVLSDPESRAVYDRYGDRGRSANSVDSIDPRTLFAMVFGSDQFVSLIGELQLASLASNVDENGNVPSEQVLHQIQRSRVGKVALEMVKMLKPWVDGDKKGFLRNMQAFKLDLLKAKYGPKLLKVVGNAYLHHTAFLDDRTRVLPFSGVIRKAHIHSHRMVSHHRAIHAAEKVMEKQRKLHDRVVKTGKSGSSISHDEAKDIAIEMAETAIDMMWKISIIDIESTLEEVLAIVMNGRDLIVDQRLHSNSNNPQQNSPPTRPAVSSHDRWKSRKRIRSHLVGERRDQSTDENGVSNNGLIHPLPPLKHGQAATTRQQVLSERARGIRAIGGLFSSKPQ